MSVNIHVPVSSLSKNHSTVVTCKSFIMETGTGIFVSLSTGYGKFLLIYELAALVVKEYSTSRLSLACTCSTYV